MQDQQSSALSKRFEEFAKTAFLDVLVPRESDFDVAALLRDGSYEGAPSRRHLFFDEISQLQLVLKSSSTQDAIRTLLPKLEVIVAAHATDAVPEGTGNAASASGKYDLASLKMPASEGVDFVTVEDKCYAVWKPTIHLARPQIRLQRPAVYFTVNISPTSEAFTAERESQMDYLPSYQPLPANILDPLRFDPALSGLGVYVSESKITKVAPLAAPPEDSIKPVRGATKRAFPIVPALFTRIQYSTVHGAILVSVHLETSQVIAGDIIINDVAFEVPDIPIERLNDLTWPQRTSSGDENIVLFKATAEDCSKAARDRTTASASLNVSATALLEQGSRIELKTNWQAQIDLKALDIPKSHRWSRTLNTSSHGRQQSVASRSSKHGSLDRSAIGDESGGIIFNFTGPSIAHSGAIFALQVQCVNDADRSRTFAIVAVHIKRPAESSSTHANNGNAIPEGGPCIPASGHYRPRDVQVITPDVLVGRVAPKANIETKIRYRAMSTGMLDLGGLRIVDLESKQTLDVVELPDVYSELS